MKKIVKLSKKIDNNTQQVDQPKVQKDFQIENTKVESNDFLIDNDGINCSFESDQDIKEINRRYQSFDNYGKGMQLRSQASKNYFEKNDAPIIKQQSAPKIKPFHLQQNLPNNKYLNGSNKMNSKYYDLDSDEDFDYNEKMQNNRSQNGDGSIQICTRASVNQAQDKYIGRSINNYSQQNDHHHHHRHHHQQEYDNQMSKSSLLQRDFENISKLNEKRSFSQILPKKPQQIQSHNENQLQQSYNDSQQKQQYEVKKNENFEQDLVSQSLKLSKKLIVKKNIVSPPPSQQLQVPVVVEKHEKQVESPLLPQKSVSNAANSPIKPESMNNLFEDYAVEDIQGSFDRGHCALSIQLHDYDSDQYLVEWKNIQSQQIGSVRIKPKNTIYKLSEIKKHAPEVYIQFLETQFGSFQKYKLERELELQDQIHKKQFQDSSSYVVKVTNPHLEEAVNIVNVQQVAPVSKEDVKIVSNSAIEEQVEVITPSCFNTDKQLNDKNQEEEEGLLFANKEKENILQNGEIEYQPDIENKRYSPLLKSQVQDLPEEITFEDLNTNQQSTSSEIIQPANEDKQNEESNITIEDNTQQTQLDSHQEQEPIEAEEDRDLFQSISKNNKDEQKQISCEDDQISAQVIQVEEELQEGGDIQQQSEERRGEDMQVEENQNKENESSETEDTQIKDLSKDISEEKTCSTEKMMEKLSVNTEAVLKTPEKNKSKSQEIEQEQEQKEKKIIQIDLDTYQDDLEENIETSHTESGCNSKQSSSKRVQTSEEVEELKCRDGDDLFEPIVTPHHHQAHAQEIFETHSNKSKLEVIPEVGNDSESDNSCQNKLINSSIKSIEKSINSKQDYSIQLINDDDDTDFEEVTNEFTAPYHVKENHINVFKTFKAPLSDLGTKAARKSAPFQQIKRITNYSESSEEDEENFQEQFRNHEATSSLLSGSLGRFKSRTERTSIN